MSLGSTFDTWPAILALARSASTWARLGPLYGVP